MTISVGATHEILKIGSHQILLNLAVVDKVRDAMFECGARRRGNTIFMNGNSEVITKIIEAIIERYEKPTPWQLALAKNSETK